MRTAPGKRMGYIICPILIPPDADPETWLSVSDMEEGWSELGQILLALRAHDQRIEDNLGELLRLYIPLPPEVERTIVAVANGAPCPVDLAKSKAKGRDMINKGTGVRIDDPEKARRPRRTPADRARQNALQMLLLTGLDEHGDATKMNLLAKSGLTDNRVVRDLNILETGIKEAAHHLRSDGLQPALDAHFGLDNLQDDKRKSQADGCTIAALLLMNAAMLHQRIANGRWLPGVNDLAGVKGRTNVVSAVTRQWNDIIGHDFKPILEPAVKVIYAIEDTGKLAGLERALRHIAAEAERIAETYADMGADHAGPLFNRVMGNQASDGAFFTRPVAAAIAVRLTLDAYGDADEDTGGNAGGNAGNTAARRMDWTDSAVWQDLKILDPACGSGALLAALLTEMKRRAAARGATPLQLRELRRRAVEDAIKEMDINPISLQLAASQLTAGNQEIRYSRMGLHLMPYGPQANNPGAVAAGALELLGQQAIVRRGGELELADDRIAAQTVWNQHDDGRLDDSAQAAQNARIVIMNPPFTNRSKMGEKFAKPTQAALRDPELADFVDKNTLGSMFTALCGQMHQSRKRNPDDD